MGNSANSHSYIQNQSIMNRTPQMDTRESTMFRIGYAQQEIDDRPTSLNIASLTRPGGGIGRHWGLKIPCQ